MAAVIILILFLFVGACAFALAWQHVEAAWDRVRAAEEKLKQERSEVEKSQRALWIRHRRLLDQECEQGEKLADLRVALARSEWERKRLAEEVHFLTHDENGRWNANYELLACRNNTVQRRPAARPV